jgi:ABC-type uncharacterized transport system substrate-binding protein
VKRREFLGMLGGAAATAYPLTVPALASKAPRIGFIGPITSLGFPKLVWAFRQGLAAAGFIEGRNVVVEFRSGHDLLALTELIQSKPSVIVSNASVDLETVVNIVDPAIPLVFLTHCNPARVALVSRARNATGVALICAKTVREKLEALGRLVPQADALGLLVHKNSIDIELYSEELRIAARALGRPIDVFRITKSPRDWNAVFADRSDNLVAIATRDALPTLTRGFITSGGVVSYASELLSAYRQLGNYAGRILNGEKATDLPIQSSTDIDMVTSLGSAARLSFELPPAMISLADDLWK